MRKHIASIFDLHRTSFPSAAFRLIALEKSIKHNILLRYADFRAWEVSEQCLWVIAHLPLIMEEHIVVQEYLIHYYTSGNSAMLASFIQKLQHRASRSKDYGDVHSIVSAHLALAFVLERKWRDLRVIADRAAIISSVFSFLQQERALIQHALLRPYIALQAVALKDNRKWSQRHFTNEWNRLINLS